MTRELEHLIRRAPEQWHVLQPRFDAMTRRIALVSPYALSVFGGVQEQVLAMSRVLSSRGDDVLVLAPDAHDVDRYDTPAKVVRLGPRLSRAGQRIASPVDACRPSRRDARRT